jgi:hypothetical protein
MVVASCADCRWRGMRTSQHASSQHVCCVLFGCGPSTTWQNGGRWPGGSGVACSSRHLEQATSSGLQPHPQGCTWQCWGPAAAGGAYTVSTGYPAPPHVGTPWGKGGGGRASRGPWHGRRQLRCLAANACGCWAMPENAQGCRDRCVPSAPLHRSHPSLLPRACQHGQRTPDLLCQWLWGAKCTVWVELLPQCSRGVPAPAAPADAISALEGVCLHTTQSASKAHHARVYVRCVARQPKEVRTSCCGGQVMTCTLCSGY